MIDGAFSLAILKTSLTIFGPSPKYFYTNSDPTTLIKQASVSPATALAIIVLPVPGGPYIKTPLGASIPNFSNNSGCFKGSSIASLISYFYTSSPPMSENLTLVPPLTFNIYTLTSASVGRISTTAYDVFYKATDWFGFNNSLSRIDKTLTIYNDP